MYWSAVTMFVASTANTTEMINAPDGFRRVDNRRDQPVQDARFLYHAAEGECRDDKPDRVQHAVHAAAGDEHVNRRIARLRDVPACEGKP